ncbi:hypothetical protein NXS19_011488 [Fusarium pseudograminearum]|nr:hypothetical protein NXS19_011488 [Fusarium pseudograminearum]
MGSRLSVRPSLLGILSAGLLRFCYKELTWYMPTFFPLHCFPTSGLGTYGVISCAPFAHLHAPPTAESVQASRAGGPEASRHTVRVIQAWTLGLLYLKLGARIVTAMFPDTRLALAVRTVTRGGWMRPDTSILTRAFVLPGLAIAGAAIFGPPAIAGVFIKYNVIQGVQPGENELVEAARLAIIYRHSYPAVALFALLVKNTIGWSRCLTAGPLASAMRPTSLGKGCIILVPLLQEREGLEVHGEREGQDYEANMKIGGYNRHPLEIIWCFSVGCLIHHHY